MAIYEERLQNDLKRIRDGVGALAESVQSALRDSVRALLSGNAQLSHLTVLRDNPINRASRDIDRLCHAFIAVHLPSSGPLREISSVFRVNIALERLGDYAVTISREALQISRPPRAGMASEVELTAEHSLNMLKEAIDAFQSRSPDAARAALGMGEHLEQVMGRIYEDLIEGAGSDRTTHEMVALFVIFNMLKRVADQAKNLCEETLFAVTGEAKPRMVHTILFVDETNSCMSTMAELVGRRRYPNSGRFASAGRHPAASVDEALGSFLAEHGIEIGNARPKGLTDEMELADQQVIVSLQGPTSAYFERTPFHTVMLDWDVGAPPGHLDEEGARKHLEEMYRQLSVQIRDLMELVCGEEAD